MLVALVVLVNGQRAAAQDAAWRLYTSDDGLPETWVYRVTRGPSGHVWTSHGVPFAAEYDGYRVRRYPLDTPQTKLSEDADGSVWAPLGRTNESVCAGVQRLERDRWRPYPIPELAGTTLADTRVLAWRQGRVLVLTPQRLFEFDASHQRISTLREAGALGRFTDVHAATDGTVWVAGAHGVAHLSLPGAPTGGGENSWVELKLPPGLQDARNPFAAASGLYVVARAADNSSHLLWLDTTSHWTTVATSAATDPIVAGWRGLDGWVWLVRSDGSTFTVSIKRDDGLEVTFRRMRALSGLLFDVEPDPDGGLWLGTSLGLVRYLPTEWRRETELVGQDRHTGSLLVASSGDVFALQRQALLRHANGHWTTYPLPPGVNANVSYGKVLGELAGGRLVFRAGMLAQSFAFDPATATFSEVRHPEGRTVEVVGPRGTSEVWTITRGASAPPRIESYDGGRFTVRAQLDAEWEHGEQPRAVIETRSGDLFITPGPGGIGWIHRGVFRWLSATDGLPGLGPFSAAELPDGRVWFGGREGVLEFDGTRVRLVRAGLQTVRSIVVVPGGAVWVASNSGVHRYLDGSWLSMTEEDGLPDAALIDLVQDPNGRLWASTTAGIAGRHSDADRDGPEAMLVEGSNPSQAPPSGDVGLSFTGVDRWGQTAVGRLLYSYRVDRGPWSPFASETSLALSGLPAGSHLFTVRAMDRSGNHDRTPANLTFAVLQPWYLQPGALAVEALGASALGMAVMLFVTRHRRLERQVHARTEELRAELAERRRVEVERAKLEEQLVRSQKMEALGRLAGGVSHDFNNLLTVICSYGDLLLEEIEAADPRRQHADEIVKAAGRAAALTRQLLSFSRHQAVSRQVLDVNSVLTDLMRMLSRLLGERVKLTFIQGEQVWPVLADRGQLEQVVINLVVNARDAMPDGGLLDIETSNVVLDAAYVSEHVNSSEGPHMRLSVRDTGVGMDAATLSRIFEPFFTTKDVGQGSGLGLAMVYGIVHQSGGHVVVQSAAGRGTAFDVYFPRTEHLATADERPPAEPMATRGSEMILLVEDEPLVRDLAGRVLRRLGYDVVEAGNAEEAMALIEERALEPQLLVSDVVMPGLGGRELATRLRQRMPGLPVLLMSGYTTDPALRETAESGTAFLQKPFTPTTLGRQVQQLLGSRS